jgi:hypothetical protein
MQSSMTRRFTSRDRVAASSVEPTIGPQRAGGQHTPTRRLLDAEEMKRDPDGHADDDADHDAGEEEALDLPIDLGKKFDRRFLVRERWDDAHELSLVHVRGWAIERLWLSVVNQSRVSGSNVQRL